MSDVPAPANGSVGLVHDYLLVMRGAERTFSAISECWPDAPIYTLLWDADGTRAHFDGREIKTSYLQSLGARQSSFRYLLPLLPRAAEHLPIGDHKLVISSSSAFAHGVKPHPDAIHVCYCHSLFRYAWREGGQALEGAPRPVRPILRTVLGRIRSWDKRASERVTHYVANSGITRRHIQDIYGRDAGLVYPPVNIERFDVGTPEDFFLVVSELVPHKRTELALEAARRAGRPIKVVGGGPELKRLSRTYDPDVFLGRVSDRELEDLYARARALIVPNVEEFGIAAVEAQAAGRPVVGLTAGGTSETVVDGVTGVLVPEQDPNALAETLRYTDFDSFKPERIVANAQRFSQATFQRRFSAEVAHLMEQTPSGYPRAVD